MFGGGGTAVLETGGVRGGGSRDVRTAQDSAGLEIVAVSETTPDSGFVVKQTRKIKVLDAVSEKTISGRLRLNWSGGGGAKFPSSTVEVGADGIGTFAVPAGRINMLRVYSYYDAHVPTVLSWILADGGEIPEEYTLYLDPGTRIGGKVVDGNGRPLVGAWVTLHLLERFDYGRREQLGFSGTRFKRPTNETGDWHEKTAPKDLSRVKLVVTHEDIPDTEFQIRVDGKDVTSDSDARWIDAKDLIATNGVLKVKRYESVRFKAFDLAGKPVEGASVIACRMTRPTRVGGAVILASREEKGRISKTGKDGSASMKIGGTDEGVVAVHPEAGFAAVTMEEFRREAKLTLKPWAKVSGTVKSDGGAPKNGFLSAHLAAPGVGRLVQLDHYRYRAVAGAEGDFVLPPVPAMEGGTIHLFWQTPNEDGGWAGSGIGAISGLKPGAETWVDLSGRTLKGKLDLSGWDETIDWRRSTVSLEPVVQGGRARESREGGFVRSPPTAGFGADGDFLLPFVPVGTSRLSVSLRAMDKDGTTRLAIMAKARNEIVVPAASAAGGALDLGSVELDGESKKSYPVSGYSIPAAAIEIE